MPARGHLRRGRGVPERDRTTYVALLVERDQQRVVAGITVTLPGTATTVGVAGGIYSVQCFSVTSCQVSGSYQSAPSRYDGFSLVTGA